MHLTLQTGSFTCPFCQQKVTECMVTSMSTVFTAPVNGAHAGVGHTAVLASASPPRWMVRCGDSRTLHPHRTLRVDATTKEFTDGGVSPAPTGSTKQRPSSG